MEREERDLINQYRVDLVDDVIPVDMLPYLSCLTSCDKERIKCEEMNNGPRRAAEELLERLVRRRNGFQEFIRALRETGCEHLANSLLQQEEETLEEEIRNEENAEAMFHDQVRQVVLEDVDRIHE